MNDDQGRLGTLLTLRYGCCLTKSLLRYLTNMHFRKDSNFWYPMSEALLEAREQERTWDAKCDINK
jgi:hypothetical protein